MTATLAAPPSRGWLSADSIRHGTVWLMLALSFVVVIEPAPSDFVFFLALVMFARSGLQFSGSVAPLFAFLVIFLLGGMISLIPFYTEFEASKYVVVSIYMAIASIFFATYLATDSERRVALVAQAWKAGALIAATLGLLGAFDVAGLGPVFAEYGRAKGLFKDSNVFSTYLIFPAILLIQAIALGRTRHRILGPVALAIMVLSIVLSYSRGAQLNFLAASTIMLVATFALSDRPSTRLRIVGFSIVGLVALGIMIAILLSVENIREIFLDRLTFAKSYDAGEKGRFASQLNSLPMLLDRPLGFGPIQFRNYFPNDPHNVYINGFSSYGWLGGIAYLLLTISTFVVGYKSMLIPSPVQYMAIAAFAVFVSTSLQGVQIDTDHWRHYYWILGIVWGCYAAGINKSDRSPMLPS